MKNKFTITADSSADCFKSFYEEKKIKIICIKRIVKGIEYKDEYNSFLEYENFYEELKKGELPTTSMINIAEMTDFFEKALAEEKDGDIIHLTLSSGLSGTFNSAKMAAEELNQNLKGRKIYVVDSLSASRGIAMLLDILINLRDEGVSATEAVSKIEFAIKHQHIWVILGDLFHLRRGGRLTTFKAAIGTLLRVKPIMIVNNEGKLVIENKIKGRKESVKYLLKMLEKYGSKTISEEKEIYLLHSTTGETFEELKNALEANYPKLKLNIGMVGPVIGSHLGSGSAIIAFIGDERLKVK